jgi:hypothetical protein
VFPLPFATRTIAALVAVCILPLAACQRGFEQEYAADGQPLFNTLSFSDLRREGPLYPDHRVSATEGGCRVTTATTDTPQYVFTTRYRDCADAPKQHAVVTMRRKSDGQESEVMDLTADREPLFEHTLRIADIDGEEPPELVMLSCGSAQQPEDCEKTWLHRQVPGQRGFVNFFAGSHRKLWLGAHYIVVESGSVGTGLPSTPQDLGQPVSRTTLTEPGHLTRQVYLRHPPRRPDATDLPGMPDPNTVTWHHGLLVYADLDTATGQCTMRYIAKPDGELRALSPVPAVLERFCAATLRP